MGDVTCVKKNGIQILCHVSNSIGIHGSGVVVALAQNLPLSMKSYEKWYENRNYNCKYRNEKIPFELGEVQFVDTGINDIIVANCVAQKGPGRYKVLNGESIPPIRLWSLKECMIEVADLAKELISRDKQVTIIGPKFGSLRAGGDWNKDIVPLINEVWSDLNVVIYEYQEKPYGV